MPKENMFVLFNFEFNYAPIFCQWPIDIYNPKCIKTHCYKPIKNYSEFL